MKHITNKKIKSYKNHIINEEKSVATVNKYVHDVTGFMEWSNDCVISKNTVLEYKQYLLEHYAVTSVNSVISSLNSFFEFCGWNELKVKTVKVQKQIFESSEKQLTKGEYERLLQVAEKKSYKLFLLMQCICATGLRVSELKFITVEAVSVGKAEINNKGKRRTVFVPKKLCKVLKAYIKAQKISSGSIFISKNGKPLDCSNIWSSMKKLCAAAGVAAEKVFPHNLRHLFARTYYKIQKDIVRLSDILGHSNINTTRIYTKENGDIHRQQIQRLGLLLC